MKIPWYLMAKGKGGGTKTASGPIAHWTDGVDAPLKSLIVNIDPVQAGTGDPSPENVRPISGWDGMTVEHTGRNLVPKGVNDAYQGITYTVNDDGSVVATGTASAVSFWAVRFSIPEGSYVLSGCPSGGSGSTYVADIRNAKGGTGIGIGVDTGNGVSFTITEPLTAYLNIRIASGYACPTGGIKFYPMIRLASDADTTYTPYIGESIPISWQSAGTVYGGTLDVVSGKLRVDRAMVDLGTLEWSMQTVSHRFYAGNAVNAKPSGNYFVPVNCLCSIYATKSQNQIYANQIGVAIQALDGTAVFVYDTAYDNAETFKTAMNGVQLVYELATPITIPLTPQEISTLQGQNNVWADSGDVTVEYLSAGGANADLMKLAVAFMGKGVK